MTGVGSYVSGEPLAWRRVLSAAGLNERKETVWVELLHLPQLPDHPGSGMVVTPQGTLLVRMELRRGIIYWALSRQQTLFINGVLVMSALEEEFCHRCRRTKGQRGDQRDKGLRYTARREHNSGHWWFCHEL